MTRLRLTIAKRLKEAQDSAAMLTTFNEVDMQSIIQMRKDYSEDFQKKYSVKLGFMSFFAKASVVALNNDFRNQSVVLTGQEPMRVDDLLKMIVEIMGLDTEIEFENFDKPGHYVRTPYSYKPQIGRKYTPPLHVDLGQGLLQLIEYVKNELNKEI